LDSV